MNKITIILVIAIIIVGAGAFYGGMLYGKSTAATGTPNFRNLTQQQRQQLGGNRTGRNNASGGFTSGQVIAKDDKSVTVQLSDGSGSKIVFFSATTQLMKLASSTLQDLQVGEQITTNGTANSDGSITAQSIQIRPAIPNQSNGQQ